MPGLAILGATGGLGEKLVARGLELNYRVSALVRDPSKVRRQIEELSVFEFDAETGAGLAAGLERCQFVVCAVGGLKPVVTACMKHLLTELPRRKKPAERVVLVSRIGTSESRPQSSQVSGPLQGMLPTLLGPVFRDLNQAEALLRTSRVPYSIFRATRLTDDKPTGNVVAVPANEQAPHRVSRVDLARFIIDTLLEPEWAGREVTVGSAER